MGEGLGVDDSWDPVSLEQAGRREGGKIRRVERGRRSDRLHNARLGPLHMCSLFLNVCCLFSRFWSFFCVWWGG